MSLINSDKLVMLSGFKAFANKCKRIFRPTYKKVTKNPYICITTSLAWTTNFECQFTINGLSNTNLSVISNALIGLSNGTLAYGAVYNLTSLGIQSGKLTPINNKVALIIEIPNLKSINVDASVFLNDKLYNVVEDITFLETCDYDTYPFGVNLNIEEDPDSIIIRNIGEGGSTTEFSVIDASGFTNNYRDGIQFNSIEKAGKLADSKKFRIDGAVTGQCSSDLSGEVYINTTLNTNDKNLSNLLDYKLSQVSVDKATTLNYGTIKLGTNPSKTALNLKCDSTYGAYVELVNQAQMPYLILLDSIPTVAGDFSSGDIIQYVGESTDTLKNGFIYQASEYEDTKLNRTYYFNFGSTGLLKTDADYNSDNNPFKNIIDLIGDLSSITLTKKSDLEIQWISGDKYLTNDYILDLLGNTLSNKNLLDGATSLTINILSLESAVEKKLLWKPKLVLEGASGSTYTAGTNIDITDYVVSATGYTYNSDNNSITLGSGTIASGENQVVMGTYNIENPDQLVIVGNGLEDSRSTAYALDINGNLYVLGNTGYDVIYDYLPLDVIDINYASKKYNVYNPDQISESGITINVTTLSTLFTGVREVILHVFNKSTLDALLTINSADSGICKCINNLPNIIPAGNSMEIVFTYLDSGYVTYKGWIEGIQEPLYEVDLLAENCTIQLDSGINKYKKDSIITFTLTPNSGYLINNVNALAGETKLTLTDLGNNRYRFVMPESKVTIKVDLLVITYTLTVNSDNGTITVTKDGVVTTDTTFDYGTLLTLTAIPNEHYHINLWPDGTNNSTYTFNITENTTISGVFAINLYTVNISSTNGTVTGAGTYSAGTEVLISATPNDGYSFTKWSDEVTDNPRTITVNSDITLEAIFELLIVTYTVSASASNGTVTGSGTFNSGDSCVLTVTPNEGYTFKQWSDDNTNNPRTIVVTQNIVLTAVCEKTIVVGLAVDLGLPSGTLWANMNIGATTPEGLGNYYAWGETETKVTYTWNNYKYGNSIPNITKYTSSDSKITLEPDDDAATVKWSGTWRMPTDAEWTELRENCTWTWTTKNGVNGYEVKGSNGNAIFLPAAGIYSDDTLDYAGNYGYYWSSSLYEDNYNNAWNEVLLSNGVGRGNGSRFSGQSIRPVKLPSTTEIYYNATSDLSTSVSSTLGSVNLITDNCTYNSETGDGILAYNGNVTEIGPLYFKNKTELIKINLPNTVTCIGDHAFYLCSSLTSITIPNSVTNIQSEAFCSCSELTHVIIPNSVTNIGSYAFYKCSGLNAVTIGNSVTSIGLEAFSDCNSLISIVVESGNSTFDSRNGCNAIIATATNTLVVGCPVTIIPNNVTSIGRYAFSWCYSITSITIPNSVTNIGLGAFCCCFGLTSVTIPNSITSIGDYAFLSCRHITSIVIPNSVTSIGMYAFDGCSGLTSVTISDNVTSIGDNAFYNCSKLATITYTGTPDQWSVISKGSDWASGVATTVVHCTDGDVNI